MKKKFLVVILVLIVPIALLFTGCSQAETVTHNLQKNADKFNIYRRITFVNLYTNEPLYSAEGYFSIQTTYSNDYQGQQEIGVIFKVGADEFKMDYFSIDNNVAYVIEQIENTSTDPYRWQIVWYVAIPDSVGG
jgi:hypothetical protein